MNYGINSTAPAGGEARSPVADKFNRASDNPKGETQRDTGCKNTGVFRGSIDEGEQQMHAGKLAKLAMQFEWRPDRSSERGVRSR